MCVGDLFNGHTLRMMTDGTGMVVVDSITHLNWTVIGGLTYIRV